MRDERERVKERDNKRERNGKGNREGGVCACVCVCVRVEGGAKGGAYQLQHIAVHKVKAVSSREHYLSLCMYVRTCLTCAVRYVVTQTSAHR